jgi:hypothetical protein
MMRLPFPESGNLTGCGHRRTQLPIGVCSTIRHYPHDLFGEGDQCVT